MTMLQTFFCHCAMPFKGRCCICMEYCCVHLDVTLGPQGHRAPIRPYDAATCCAIRLLLRGGGEDDNNNDNNSDSSRPLSAVQPKQTRKVILRYQHRSKNKGMHFTSLKNENSTGSKKASSVSESTKKFGGLLHATRFNKAFLTN